MPAWEYSVRRIPLESYDEIDNALEAAITSQAGDDWELVSCFPEQLHHMGMIHELPTTEPGADPYDAIWQGPMGPTFITVFRRPIGD